jgi:hypothetical protein
MPKSHSPGFGFDPSILQHNGILWAEVEAVLNKVPKNPKNPPLKTASNILYAKLLDEDTKQLDEYEPEFVRNLKGLAENEYKFQLSKKRLAEAEYAIQFSETPPRRERVLDLWTLDRWTEH